MRRARLAEERCHPRSASVLYDLSRSLEYPILAIRNHILQRVVAVLHFEHDATCHSCADCGWRTTDTRYDVR